MRNILFIIVLFISVKGYSQDIIITKEGKSIKAKIIELTEEKISYKKYEYQEGATIVLSIENIRRIVWQTGEIEDFNVNEHSEKEKIEKEEEKITE
ncbi:MAG: hypothetical protein LBI60_02390, partial [Bacteroidales bacterium]|nr:hypothetical protein [Bacteroidales bacterium]